jgi:hypothetical protein
MLINLTEMSFKALVDPAYLIRLTSEILGFGSVLLLLEFLTENNKIGS